MDLNLLSLIISIAAVLSPIGVAHLNNLHSLKIKRFEEKEKLKNQILLNCLDEASERCLSTHTTSNYYKAQNKALIYVDYSIFSKFDNDPSEENLHKLVKDISGKITFNNLKE